MLRSPSVVPPFKLWPPPCCRFSGVHRLNAGLWGRQANITLSSNGCLGCEWGKVCCCPAGLSAAMEE